MEGAPVVPLRGTDDKGSRPKPYVTSEGVHHPVKTVQTEDGKPGTSVFSGYDKPLPAATPSAAGTVDAVEFRAKAKAAAGT
jgi:hypothetical protein